NAFFVSVARTVLSTAGNLFLTAMLAYALGRREYLLRKPLTVLVVFTMYISAGLIPYYFLIKSLGLINSFLVYVVPSLVGAFNFIVIRTYIQTIPESLVESARMDGGGDFLIFLRLILPLSAPVLATVALFVAVGSWNSWFDTLLFASGRQELSTLQYELMKFLSASQAQSKSAADVGALGMAKDASSSMVTPVSIRAAITVVAAIPILIVYPFLQKHFVTGLAVGGVKE
ncbi:MAG TPA: carbohydrate ABC transporter permease, partial [Spirochaetia bacterium]|nr:carbohydrate ABC transporter permease [Spirochaetia bacterium]